MNSILFTGASGFLGKNVLPILKRHYAVKTLGLTPADDYSVNIANVSPTLSEHFDIVLHAAGKAHVIPKTEAEKQLYYDVNLQGTKNLCAGLESSGFLPKSFIFISTVAVYGCELGENITEEHPLEGNSPYADSKKQAESFLTEWCGRNGVILGIIRPSLLAGPNAPGNLGAMVRGIQSGRYLSIAGGKARKSVMMVQDIANLVPLVAEKGGVYNVCDSEQPTYRELEKLIAMQLGVRRPISIPFWLAKSMFLIGDCIGDNSPINSMKLRKITESLTFSNEKARRELGWTPMSVLKNYKVS